LTTLLDIHEGIDSPNVLVFGDLILDHYVEGESNRVSPEAPVLVFNTRFSHHRLGGAGNVAANVVSAGGRATCLGLVGHDASAETLRRLLEEAGVDASGVIAEDARPTTLKTRFVSRTHQVLRVDEETLQEPGPEAVAKIRAYFDAHLTEFDSVVLSDYGKGALSEELLAFVIARANAQGIPVIVDPKGRDYGRYRGATLITPNKVEAEHAAGFAIENHQDLDRVATYLTEQADLQSIVITLGKEGIYLRTNDGRRRVLPTEARAVFDVTGAGDTVVALLGLALGGGVELPDAVRLANVGAGVVVGRFGTAAVTRDEIRGALRLPSRGKLLDDASLMEVLVGLRAEKKRIVFTNGCFDLLHPGHLNYLAKARSYGDILIVGVNTDESIRRLKGPNRPICPLSDRLELLAALEMVDFVVPFADDTPLALIERISPNVLVKGEDWRDKGVVGREWVESNGGQVVLVPLMEGHSTTGLIERIRGLDG